MAPANELWYVSTWYPDSTIRNAVRPYQLRGFSPLCFYSFNSKWNTAQHAKLQLAREGRKVYVNKQADPLESRVIGSLATPRTGLIKTGNVCHQPCPQQRKKAEAGLFHMHQTQELNSQIFPKRLKYISFWHSSRAKIHWSPHVPWQL